ncbi:MAG: hypothetical protein GOV02_03530 [Candidatus Aenigmarchaeota archaeon]|nr:hypothetical protein [Candidatus Aenigmarchaeota archaeon]
MISETENILGASAKHTKNLKTYTPKQAEKRYLLRKVKQKYNVIKDICDRHDRCQDCDFMLDVLSSPIRYPDLQSCNFPTYNNKQLKRLLDIPE